MKIERYDSESAGFHWAAWPLVHTNDSWLRILFQWRTHVLFVPSWPLLADQY